MIIDNPIDRSFLAKTLTLRQREVQASTEKYKPLTTKIEKGGGRERGGGAGALSSRSFDLLTKRIC